MRLVEGKRDAAIHVVEVVFIRGAERVRGAIGQQSLIQHCAGRRRRFSASRDECETERGDYAKGERPSPFHGCPLPGRRSNKTAAPRGINAVGPGVLCARARCILQFDPTLNPVKRKVGRERHSSNGVRCSAALHRNVALHARRE